MFIKFIPVAYRDDLMVDSPSREMKAYAHWSGGDVMMYKMIEYTRNRFHADDLIKCKNGEVFKIWT